MAEFSCEFCKAELKDKTSLQRHLKTSKKCLSKRTPRAPTEKTVSAETVSVETVSAETVSVETVSAETNHNNLLTKALKELEVEKIEVAFIKEKLISLFNSEKQRDRIRGLTNDYTVSMYCSCGVLKFMKEEKMKEMLDETTGNVIFKVDDNPDRFERDIFISMTKKTSKK
jgi:hypothetical protein